MRITAKFNSCWFLFFPGNVPSPLGTSKNNTFFIFREIKDFDNFEVGIYP